MPVEAAIIALVILAIVFSPAKRKRWKCPAPDCDFSVEQEKAGAAKEHTLIHAKHQPVLRDE